MKNIIFLIVDSVNYAQIKDKSNTQRTMPFLNELKEKCIYTSKMYAQAPFTEAALTPLLSGIDLLDYGGYMKRFAYRKTFSEIFHDHGYETFINHYYSCVYPSKTFLGIDKRYYVNFFDFSQVYGYRFSYYKDLFMNNQLQLLEYTLLDDILEDNLKEWIHISEMVLAKDEQVSLLLTYGECEGIENDLEILRKEYALFQIDSRAYLKNIYEQGNAHPLFVLPVRTLKKKVSKQFSTQVNKEFHPIFKKIYKMNRNRNLRNLPIPITKTLKAFLKKDMHSAYQYMAMYKNAVFDCDVYDRINGNYGDFKAAISMKAYIKHALAYIDNKKNEKPFCMYLHVDDAHSPENFFTSESNDIDELKEEFAKVQQYLHDLPKRFKGSLTSSLSLLYVDSCIKYFFQELKQRGILNNTVVAITADHGFSYNYLPIRDVYVNNVYEENFHTPFFIYDESIRPACKEHFYMSKDILPTLLDCCNIPIPKEITGESILSSQGRNYALLEYMGGGCPDMLRREIILGCRSEKYSVVIKLHLEDKFNAHHLTHVFDCIKDPLEEKNLAHQVQKLELSFEMGILKERFESIQNNFKEQDHAFS